MKKLTHVLSFIMLLGFSFVAHAGRELPTVEYCQTSATSADELACIQVYTKVEDDHLNEVYKQAMSRIEEFRRGDMRQMEKAWISYRDLKCNFYYHKQSGRGGLADSAQCLLDETKRRAEELEALY